MDPTAIAGLASGAASAFAKPPESKSETNNRIVNRGPKMSTRTELGAQDIKLKRLKVGKKANVTLNLGGEPTTAPEVPDAAPAASSGGLPSWTLWAGLALFLLLVFLLLRR